MHPHRCSRCNKRRSLRLLWKQYERPPKCLGCGYFRLYLCKDRYPSRHGRKLKCNCGGYVWDTKGGFHRKGSKYCKFNPNAEQHWSERYEESS